MADTAILAAAALLLFAYLVDIVGRHFRLPSVVMLIIAGIALRQVAEATGFHLRWVDPIVPLIGTIGLILIVLEGALDLNVVRERMPLIAISSTSPDYDQTLKELGAVMLVVLMSAAATGFAHRGVPRISPQGPDSVAKVR